MKLRNELHRSVQVPTDEPSLGEELPADGLVARDVDNCNKNIQVSQCSTFNTTRAANLEVLNIPSPHDANVSGEEIIFCATVEMSFRVVASTALTKYSTGFL